LKTPSGNGVLGLAADLVEAPAELRPALELLLGQVVVTADRVAARRVLAGLPDGARVVTLRGELFHHGGPIEVRSAKAAASLSRPRTLRELNSKQAAIDQQLQSLENALAGTAQQLASEQGHERELNGAHNAANQESELAQRALQSAQLELEQLERQRGWFEAQQRSLQLEIDGGGEQLAKLAEEKAELTSQVDLAQADLEAHTISLVDLPLDEHRAQAAHWEMRLAVSQRAQQEAQRRHSERQTQLKYAQDQLEGQALALQELEQQEEAIGAAEMRSKSQEGEVGEEITAIQAQIGPAEQELTHIETQLGALQENDRNAMAVLSAAERANTQAQIALARQQESLETLRTRIEDDFGLVAFEYDEAVSGPTPLPLGDLVEHLPAVESITPEVEDTLKEQRGRLRRLGSVNPEAQNEFQQVKERFESMQIQVADLSAAEVDLQEVIAELDLLMDKEFRHTFDIVAAEFREIFSRLFNGGAAHLLLTEEEDMTNTGIDIEARLPGKRAQRLALLSGGERSLTAAALVFALLKASPTPFCVMDEVDAMLDEANVGRFTELLRELSADTQFVVITHNRNTVQASDVIYGVTMGRDTSSQVISLRLDEVDERYSP
jgi:chromosome segregation protein